MPIIKSAIKRVKTSEKRHEINTAFQSAMRTSVKTFEAKVNEKDLDGAKKAYADAVKNLDKAARKGIIHKNKAARHKTQLAKKLNDLSA